MKTSTSTRRIAALSVLLAAAGFGALAGAAPRSVGDFAALPVLHEGRVKPLDTMARAVLLGWSARGTYHGEAAARFFARLVFEPESTETNDLFRVNHPEAARALGLEPAKNFRYRFDQLREALPLLQEMGARIAAVPDKERNPVEKDLAALLRSVNEYLELRSAARFAEPLVELQDPALAAALGFKPGDAPSWLDLRPRAKTLLPFLSGGANAAREAAEIARFLQFYEETFARFSFAATPRARSEGGLAWTSPWAEAAAGRSVEPAAWAALRGAWRSGDEARFQREAALLAAAHRKTAAAAGVRAPIGLELFYNRLDAFTWAKTFFLIAFLAALALVALPRNRLHRAVHRGALGLFALGLAFTVTGIACRMAITGRPPITNLYETFLFVSAVIAFAGLALEAWRSRGLGLTAGAAASFLLLMVSGRFAAEGDTLRVLVAVLDSNFWLSTHVIAINLGYAGVVFSGVLAHVYLIRRLLPGASHESLKALAGPVYGVQAFGLIFTFFGTMLGGVWADQSWGRFWGWDPKENGALLIVLWSAALFHARLAGWIRDALFSAGAVLGIVVVMMAWFGINLLGVGLHSYGFTNGVAAGLFGYVALEVFFLLAVLWVDAFQRSRADRRP